MRARRLIRPFASLAGRTPAFSALLGLLERVDRGRENLLPVLAYHRVDDPAASPNLDPGLISATPAEFEAQMTMLAAGCHVVSMAELLDARSGSARLRRRSVMVTVDDAYRDFAEHVWPTMRRLGLPVTLFVPTGYPDCPERGFWWDRLYAALSGAENATLQTSAGSFELQRGPDGRLRSKTLLDRLKDLPHKDAMAVVDEIVEELGSEAARDAALGWDDLRGLAREGVTLAPHSRSHSLLTRIPEDEARLEIVGSLEDLEREAGPAARAFAYPSGAFNDRVVRLLDEAGFSLGFGLAKWGGNDLRREPWLQLRRILVTRRLSLPLVRAQLLPSLSRFNGVSKARWA